MNSLQKHYNREHKETDDADEVDPGIDYDEDVEPDFDEDRARSDLCCHASEFLLRTKEHAKIKLTQTTLDMVKDSTKALHCGFICNRIDFDAVTPSVYTTPIDCYRNRVDLKPVPKVQRFQNDAVSSVV